MGPTCQTLSACDMTPGPRPSGLRTMSARGAQPPSGYGRLRSSASEIVLSRPEALITSENGQPNPTISGILVS